MYSNKYNAPIFKGNTFFKRRRYFCSW